MYSIPGLSLTRDHRSRMHFLVFCKLSRLQWVGSVVGAVPPLMGWVAATSGVEPGGLILAGILFAWQVRACIPEGVGVPTWLTACIS